MDLCNGYKLQVQEYHGYKFAALRRFYYPSSDEAAKAGIPGFNLNPTQWLKLKELRQKLIEAANSKSKLLENLGHDKFVEVKQGTIYLKRAPEDCDEEFLKRNTVALYPRLWQKIWQQTEWLEQLLLKDDSSINGDKFEYPPVVVENSNPSEEQEIALIPQSQPFPDIHLEESQAFPDFNLPDTASDLQAEQSQKRIESTGSGRAGLKRKQSTPTASSKRRVLPQAFKF
jgi:hypothetical protein